MKAIIIIAIYAICLIGAFAQVPELVKANEIWVKKSSQLKDHHSIAIGKSAEKYESHLRATRKRFVAKGALTHVVAIDAEIESMSTGKYGTPDKAYAKERQTFFDECAKLDAIYQKGLSKLQAKYIGYLNKLSTKLTKANRIEDALVVLNVIKSFDKPKVEKVEVVEEKKAEPKKEETASGEIKITKVVYGEGIDDGLELSEAKIKYVRIPHPSWLDGKSSEGKKLYIEYTQSGKTKVKVIDNNTLFKLERDLK